MDQFSYLSVLISIILGLGITQLVTGLGRLIQARDRVKLYAPALAWVGLLLVIHVQTWWAMFGLRNHSTWNFGQFFVVLLQPLVLSLLASLVVPDFGADAQVDLRANYYAHSRWFFSLLILLLVVSLVKDVVLSGSLPSALNVAAHVDVHACVGRRDRDPPRGIPPAAGTVHDRADACVHRRAVRAAPVGRDTRYPARRGSCAAICIVSRTFDSSDSGVNGFSTNWSPASRTDCALMASAV